jgi:hypothetical protein
MSSQIILAQWLQPASQLPKSSASQSTEIKRLRGLVDYAINWHATVFIIGSDLQYNYNIYFVFVINKQHEEQTKSSGNGDDLYYK